LAFHFFAGAFARSVPRARRECARCFRSSAVRTVPLVHVIITPTCRACPPASSPAARFQQQADAARAIRGNSEEIGDPRSFVEQISKDPFSSRAIPKAPSRCRTRRRGAARRPRPGLQQRADGLMPAPLPLNDHARSTCSSAHARATARRRADAHVPSAHEDLRQTESRSQPRDRSIGQHQLQPAIMSSIFPYLVEAGRPSAPHESPSVSSRSTDGKCPKRPSRT